MAIENKFKSYLKEKIKNNTSSNQVLISFGEIDCRESEGILKYSIKYNKNIEKVCFNTIVGYLNFMENNLSYFYKERYYFGTPAPYLIRKNITEIDIKRKKLIEIYNLILKKEVLSRGAYFIDVYGLTSNNGWNNNNYMMDEQHLDPSSLPKLIERHFYEKSDSC